MFASAVVVTFVSAFVILVVLGHILLIAAVWRDLPAAPEPQPDAGAAGAETGPAFEQAHRAKAA